MTALFRDPRTDRQIRECAVELLGHGGPDAVAALTEALDDSNLALVAVSSLRKIGPAALPALTSAAASPDPAVREQARQAIHWIRSQPRNPPRG